MNSPLSFCFIERSIEAVLLILTMEFFNNSIMFSLKVRMRSFFQKS